MGKKKKSTPLPPVESESEESASDVSEDEGKSEKDVEKKVTFEKSGESKGQMTQRHKREDKELKKKIQEILHSFPKNDKKAKKDAQELTQKMEQDQKTKHAQELAELEAKMKQEKEEPEDEKEVKSVSTVEEKELNEEMENVSISKQEPEKNKQSRAKRKKAALAAKEKERDQRIAQEKKNTVDHGAIESYNIKKKLSALGLTYREIPPDGNCLYSAVADQLKLRGQKNDYRTLRAQASQYMLKNPDDFMPFIDSDDGMISQDGFKDYCDKVANTTVWGGQLELRALSNSLQSPITVFTADNGPNIEMGTDFDTEPLKLTYHRRAYTLGEHYNSVISLNQV
eukprot:TRINITY_DN1489_c0_g1_i1.p1 TRINITY_DN1489_c0_g1~~TRINITY_DN1489_c0_g1_i1.p1  ORF type:complete len:341 (-),score=104.98 TRINITY_DN1489_c0_g1_i1:443-1465(-)